MAKKSQNPKPSKNLNLKHKYSNNNNIHLLKLTEILGNSLKFNKLKVKQLIQVKFKTKINKLKVKKV